MHSFCSVRLYIKVLVTLIFKNLLKYLVIGILDKALSKRLQMDPKLTLEKAARMVRQSESVGEQQRVLKRQKDSELEVNWMTSKSKAVQQRNPSSSCTRCGNQHEPGKCPAQKVTCFRCH